MTRGLGKQQRRILAILPSEEGWTLAQLQQEFIDQPLRSTLRAALIKLAQRGLIWGQKQLHPYTKTEFWIWRKLTLADFPEPNFCTNCGGPLVQEGITGYMHEEVGFEVACIRCGSTGHWYPDPDWSAEQRQSMFGEVPAV